MLDRLVLQELQMQRANRAGIKVSGRDAEQRAAATSPSRTRSRSPTCPTALASQGIDYASYREGIRKELAMQILRQRDVIGRINVSPREIDQFLERQKKMPSESNEYNVSHILIAVPQAATPEELDDAAKRADEVYQRATARRGLRHARGRVLERADRARRRLARLAQGHRSCPTFLAEVIAGMKAGDITKPMRTPSGFHIIKLNEMRGRHRRSS